MKKIYSQAIKPRKRFAVKKLTHQQKQDVNSVLTKYGTKKETIASSLTGGALSIVIDMAATGGTASLISLFCFAAYGASMGVLIDSGLGRLWTNQINKAGQKVGSTRPVICALEKMEEHLSESFSLAAKDVKGRQAFEAVSQEVQADLKKLSPAFEIVSGGPNGYGTERYEFVLASEQPALPAPVITTLSGVDSKNEVPPPPVTSLASKALLKIAKY